VSTNIHFKAEREILVVKTGKTDTQVEYVTVWQTPTNVTYDIVNSPDPIVAYIDWVKSVSNDVQEPVYADDDIFHEEEPIGTETFNPGLLHIKDFEHAVQNLGNDGYTITAEAW